jgi:cell division protein ZapA (FtsZ GTPase activity inhibitor)
LNVADEYFKLQGEKEDICHQMESRSEQLIHLINELRQ